MREEQVTKIILEWLINSGWKIVCFDFPQSGTGKFLHANGSLEKNKDTINPDIVAVKDNICLFFENKDRFYFPDFQKQNMLRENNNYTDDIDRLLEDFSVKNIFYGIGLPVNKFSKKAFDSSSMVDFIIGVDETKKIVLLANKAGIYWNL